MTARRQEGGAALLWLVLEEVLSRGIFKGSVFGILFSVSAGNLYQNHPHELNFWLSFMQILIRYRQIRLNLLIRENADKDENADISHVF